MKEIGILYGSKLLLETEDEDTVKHAKQYLDNFNKQYIEKIPPEVIVAIINKYSK